MQKEKLLDILGVDVPYGAFWLCSGGVTSVTRAQKVKTRALRIKTHTGHRDQRKNT
jgi:hypothetical protein